MVDLAVRWRPASAPELGRRRQIVTHDQAGFGIDTLLLGLGVVVGPVVLVVATSGPLRERILFAVVASVVCLVTCSLSLRGLYLSSEGVTVWNLFPRSVIRWTDLDRFELRTGPIDLGRNRMERLFVVSNDGKACQVHSFRRYVDFEERMTPVESVKAALRTYPALVGQLNQLRNEMARFPAA